MDGNNQAPAGPEIQEIYSRFFDGTVEEYRSLGYYLTEEIDFAGCMG